MNLRLFKFQINERLIFIVFLFSCSSAIADSDSRHALIIGNSDYQYASPLKNPKNDSADIAEALEDLYFDTTLLQNANKAQIEEAITEFLEDLQDNGGVGLFYYAGHGIQLQGNNYLVPVETNTGTDIEIKHQSYNIANLLAGMRQIQTATNIIILDACRDNPFENVIAKNGQLFS